MRVAISTSSFAQYGREPLDLLERAGADFILNPHGRKLTPDEVVELAAGCDGLVAGTEPLDRSVLSRLPNLKVLSRCGVGMDNVDLEAAEELGVLVRNTPLGPTRAVAELIVGLAMDLLRQVTRMDRELRAGVWKKRMGNLLQGKRVGIIGMGRIGVAVAELLTPFDVEIGYADPVSTVPGYTKMGMEELLPWADIVSLHCSRTGMDCALLDRQRLVSMKPGSWLINAGRGGLVDEEALYDLLSAGHLAGAAVDCFCEEPYQGRLRELDSVILTPHIGSYAREGRVRMEADAVSNLLEALEKTK
ncbi:phosphoglycerate dehydrogenase [Desulfohalovibrio reitneri]|uniref:phosphoglycerate dehydrogenase n=1 Tax=Desulfohalovibrio reitneri TaxID=1307759 RepID=UPI0004A7597A|nr:phosphoglycerate dehydrogenase [Desulfohalovibrio reitneri]